MPLESVDYIWMNGEMVKWEDAKIHVLTHALHYGSGVFEGIRCYHTGERPVVFRLRDHIKRLYNSARIYFMTTKNKIGRVDNNGDEVNCYSVDQLCEAAKDVIRKNSESLMRGNKKIAGKEIASCYIRPIVYRGYGEMGLYPLNSDIDVAIAVWAWGSYLGDDDSGIRVKTSTYERINANVMPPGAKATGQYINSILASIEAKMCGYQEALLLDNRGFVSEGPGENLFIIRNGKLYTPPLHASILDGITRDSVIAIADDLGYDVVESDIDRGMVYSADAAFFTGTAAEITPIREIDGQILGEGLGEINGIIREIRDKFFDIIENKNCKYDGTRYGKWLDYVDM